MVFHFLKSAWRNLFRNRTFSLLNISGLTIGIASFILIMLFVNYENSYDRFFENSDRIYRVYMDYLEGEEYVAGDAQTYNNSGPSLKDAFPEIEDYVRMYQLKKASLVYNNSIFELTNGHLTDPSYFNVFSFPLLQGDEKSALSEPNRIVLTENTASKIFGQKTPIGRIVKLFHDGEMNEFTVSGVLKNIPENTYIKTNFLVSYSSNKNWPICSPVLNWNNNNFFTYILANQGIDEEQLRSKIIEYSWIDNQSEERHNIELLADVHLHSNKPYEAEANGNAGSVNFLFAIAVIILILSWLNYTNLSIAKSMERAKETGVRKSNGARKIQLVVQFLIESVLLNAFAIICAAAVVIIALPAFNSFTGKNLFDAIQGSGVFIFLILVMILGAVISGLYPALLLSNIKLTEILKGKNRGNGNVKSRSVFVTIQFVASIALIIGTILISKQIRYLQNQPLGFNNEQILTVKGENLSGSNTENDIRILKEQIQNLPLVHSVAGSQTFPGQGFLEMNSMMGMVLPNGEEDKQTVWYNHFIDENYIPLMELELLAGRNYRNSDNSEKVLVINEKAALQMGFENAESALNQVVQFWGNSRQIIGVLKDYSHFGVKTEIEPLVLTYYKNPTNHLLVKLDNNLLSTSGIQNTLNQIEELWKAQFQQSTFEIEFIDQTFAAQFEEDRKFGKVFGAFTGLAIFIAILGLIGLASYLCIQRTKEIGIRKVNGAKVSEILTMLNRDFIKWVAIAFVIACPIAWFAMNKWLENFAHKTTLSWWIFALAGVLALGIALLTVSWQSWRAATRNPVEALRYE